MSFPRYESYKDSGVEWIGRIPSNWLTSKIKFNTYVKARVGWHGLNASEFNDIGIHLVTGSDFENGFVNWERCYRISEERYVEDPYIHLKENDLLITKDGTIGKLARVKGLPGRASLNSGIFLVRAKDSAYSEDFLYWVLQSSLFSHFMDLHKIGSTIQHLYQEVFNQFSFPIPSKSEQHLICVFLDRETAKIDALIAEQQRLIELLKEKRQAVISHAVTKGLNPDAPMKDSGIEWLGEVPAHWEVVRLGRRITLQRGVDITKDEQNEGIVPVVSSGGVLSFHDRPFATGPGVIVGRKGTAGAVYYIDSDYWPHDTTLWVKEFRGNSPRYVFYKLCAMTLASFDTGSANPTLNRNLVHPVFVSWPPIDEQCAIIAFLDCETAKLDALTAEAQRAITLLQERRTALISVAVTGKIDVRGLVAARPTVEVAA